MKKILSLLLVLVIGFIVYYFYQDGGSFTELIPTQLNSIAELLPKLPEAATKPVQPSQAAIGEIKKPETAGDTQIAIAYEKSQNKDTIGWLRIPGSKVNHSVLQSNNNAYYLNHDERRNYSVYGSLYADYECSTGTRDEMSVNTIIYGHSDLKDNPEGPMFSQLFRFEDAGYARSTPYLYFSTAKEEMVWEVFAVSYTDTSMEYVYPFISSEELMTLVKEAKDRSIYNYSVEVGPQDKILTLSTCTVKYGTSKEQRLIVMARLLPAETQLKEQAQLTPNPTPKQPNL